MKFSEGQEVRLTTEKLTHRKGEKGYVMRAWCVSDPYYRVRFYSSGSTVLVDEIEIEGIKSVDFKIGDRVRIHTENPDWDGFQTKVVSNGHGGILLDGINFTRPDGMESDFYWKISELVNLEDEVGALREENRMLRAKLAQIKVLVEGIYLD